MHVERVDGEIAPRRILAPVFGEGDGRAAAVCRDVVAQRCDLDRALFEQSCDRAMIDSGRDGANACLAAQLDDPFGAMRGGGVDILRRAAEQRVAHCAANPAQVLHAERGH